MKDPKVIAAKPLMKRLTQVMTYGLTGGYFSPQLPLQPQAQETAGRRFDYLAGYNIATRPRSDPGVVDMGLLRNFAKFYDVLRIIIEKRKDQISAFEWSIKPTDEAVAAAGGKQGDQKALAELNKRAAAAQKFLQYPDGRTHWTTWLRSIVEDLLVLDAICVWPVYKGSQLVKLETVDPVLIKINIDESGRVPEPPFPAYQQILHGLPASDYLKDELLYFMSNPASDRVYGYSKVAQIVTTIQIGLRREMSQLQFFTEGNMPAALAGVPDTWNSTQIQTLQAAFDAMMAGDTGSRRKLWFVPGDAAKNIKQLVSEEATLKAEFDEWLIRIICFTFGIAVTPFVKETTRATAYTAQEQAREEGLGPQLAFLKNTIDTIITKGLKLEGVEFVWSMEIENDPTSQATIDDTQLRNGLRSLDELRQRDGLEPLGMGNAIYLPTGPVLVKDLIAEKVGPVADANTAAQAAKNPPPTPFGGGQKPNGGGSGQAPGKGGPPKPGQPGQQAGKPGQKGQNQGKQGAKGAGQPVADKGNRQAQATDKPLGKSTDREVSAGSALPFRKRFSYAARPVRRIETGTADGGRTPSVSEDQS